MTKHTTEQSSPKLCECGCGNPAPFARITSKERGWIKGQPIRFIHGHNGRNPTSPPAHKLCECGCGQPAPISSHTDSKMGYIKGQPRRFVVGHNARIQHVPSLEERFWQRVNPGAPDECWEWQGTITVYGYGHLLLPDKRTLRAHRVSWEIHNGPIPEGLDVCHKCDNRPCVNPHHLFLGTRAENNQDMTAKGRHGYTGSKGESNPIAKLTEDDVRLIRKLRADGMQLREIGERFGVTKHTVWRIIHRKSWGHVA